MDTECHLVEIMRTLNRLDAMLESLPEGAHRDALLAMVEHAWQQTRRAKCDLKDAELGE